MNPWPFVIAAWSLTAAVSAALSAWCWLAMRAAEGGARPRDDR